MQAKTKRVLSGIGALVVAVALITGGTFAYTSREQKSNILTGRAKYQARLVETFDPDSKWEKDVEVEKKVTIKNLGGTDQFPGTDWGDIYVAVQILEYMDITPIVYEYYEEGPWYFRRPVRFMVDTNGDFVRYPVSDDSETRPDFSDWSWWANTWANVTDNAELITEFVETRNWVKIRDAFDEQEYWYLPTVANDPNGQYGAYVVTGITENLLRRQVVTGRWRVPYSSVSEYAAYRLSYSVHSGEWCDNDCHEYAELLFGEDVISIYGWDGNPVEAWIYDYNNGMAYWGVPLAPGEETSTFLEAILPRWEADGAIFYDVFVHMWAYSVNEVPEWFLEPSLIQN